MKTFVTVVWILTAGFLVSETARAEQGADVRTQFECRFTGHSVTIDGVADEAAWQQADVIDYFYLPWLQADARPAKAATKARLMWDRQFLYFFAEMEDDDLFADITEHDGKTWHNDVFEMFFKPAEDKTGYYEFHVSAAGTVMDVFLPKRGDGSFEQHVANGDFHADSKVVTNGTLNIRTDTDNGWTVEGRIPWHDFISTGGRPTVDEKWLFALCRYDYSMRKDSPELSTCAPLRSLDHADFHHYEDYATLRFVGPQRRDVAAMTTLEDTDRLSLLQENWKNVASRVVGSPEPPLPYVARRVLPELKISFPIFAINEPGSRRLYFIDQDKSYGPARLARTSDDPASGEFESLYDFPKGGVAYSAVFHPQFAENGFLYVGWNGAMGDTSSEDGDEKHSRVTRLTVDRVTGELDPESAVEIISWPSNGHNGAAIAFGLDGMLYVTSGDGTSDSDTNLTGQGLDHLLAKVLRIDVDHPAADRAYSVPTDNPFVGQEGIRPETWAFGLRNPWRMTVDRKTGDLWVGNNGQDLWEQAYLVNRGDNFGWSVYEGSHIFYANRTLGPVPHVKPTLEHPHSEARSLTGGVVYYGSRLPELKGAYIYGDYSTGKIWGAKVLDGTVVWHRELADTPLQISAFAIDADGELLIVDHRNTDGGFHTLEPNTVNSEADTFPRKLSESGLFTSVRDHQVHPGLIPYSVNSPLWSDGSFKSRFLFIPPTSTVDGGRQPTKINFQTNSSWDFPDGTVAVKSFGLEQREGDADSRRWIETRFLTKQQGEWVGYSYAWNDGQTEAVLVEKEGRDLVLDVVDVNGRPNQQQWRIPSRTECMVCHSRAAKFVLGLSSMQLNRVHDYSGAKANQLEVFEWLGLLNVNWKTDMQAARKRELTEAGRTAAEISQQTSRLKVASGQRGVQTSSLLARPADYYDRFPDPYDETADLTQRVRSYLHSNCAQCHVSAGGGNAQIQLDYATSLDKAKIVDVIPLHDKFGRDEARLVAAGSPDDSILLHRISIRGRGQMPQLATTKVDERAVQLFRQWIASMPASENE